MSELEYFVGKTYDEMTSWLSERGVDVVTFDDRSLKTLSDLYGETQMNEVDLAFSKMQRIVVRAAKTVRIVITAADERFRLRETRRVYAKGTVERNCWWSMSETRRTHETSIATAIRGLYEECNLCVRPDQLDLLRYTALATECQFDFYRSSTYDGIYTCAAIDWIGLSLKRRPWTGPRVVQDGSVQVHLDWFDNRSREMQRSILRELPAELKRAFEELQASGA